MHAVGTNELITAKERNAEGRLRASPEKWQNFIWGKVPSETPLAHLQIKKVNLRDLIEYIANKIQTLSPRPSPDTGKEFRRATTTKTSSQERNDVSVFEKVIQ